MPFNKGNPSLVASLRALCATLLFVLCASLPVIASIVYVLYRVFVIGTFSTTALGSVDDFVAFFFVDYLDLTILASAWILYEFLMFAVFRTHMKGAARSYHFCRSGLLRSVFLDYFRTDIHFDTKLTRAWADDVKKSKVQQSIGAKKQESSDSSSYDPEGEEELRLAIQMFPVGNRSANEKGGESSSSSEYQKYVVGNHPHAYLGFSIWATWVQISDVVDRVFYSRGLNATLHTFDANFVLPLWGQLLSLCGLCSVSRKGIALALQPKNACAYFCSENGEASNVDRPLARGSLACIVPGGAPESLTSALRHDILLKHKAGFVKVAMEEDALLVPVFHFGEEKCFKALLPASIFGENCIAPWFIRKLLDMTSIGFPLVRGKWGVPMLPFKTKLDVVIGEPMNPRKMVLQRFGEHSVIVKGRHHHPHFTREQVSYVHQEYIKRIEEIHARYAPIFSPDQKLTIT